MTLTAWFRLDNGSVFDAQQLSKCTPFVTGNKILAGQWQWPQDLVPKPPDLIYIGNGFPHSHMDVGTFFDVS